MHGWTACTLTMTAGKQYVAGQSASYKDSERQANSPDSSQDDMSETKLCPEVSTGHRVQWQPEKMRCLAHIAGSHAIGRCLPPYAAARKRTAPRPVLLCEPRPVWGRSAVCQADICWHVSALKCIPRQTQGDTYTHTIHTLNLHQIQTTTQSSVHLLAGSYNHLWHFIALKV